MAGRRIGKKLCGVIARRTGEPCKAMAVPGRNRCKFHGGNSYGPTTAEGWEASLAALAKARSAQRDRYLMRKINELRVFEAEAIERGLQV
jgi:hypothetical protein